VNEKEAVIEMMGWLTLTKQHERPVIAHEGIWHPQMTEHVQLLILTLCQAQMKEDHDH
jgi:hypothetical protein